MILQSTDLSGSGKSTPTNLVITLLYKDGYSLTTLHAGELRKTFSSRLGSYEADCIKKLLSKAIQKQIQLVSAINPCQKAINFSKHCYSNLLLIYSFIDKSKTWNTSTRGIYQLN